MTNDQPTPQELDRRAAAARDRVHEEKNRRAARRMAGLPVEKGDSPELVAEVKRLERLAREVREREYAERQARIRRRIADMKPPSKPVDPDKARVRYERMMRYGMDLPENNPKLTPLQRAKVALNRMITEERAMMNPSPMKRGTRNDK